VASFQRNLWTMFALQNLIVVINATFNTWKAERSGGQQDGDRIMKISTAKLKQIIKEELESMNGVEEAFDPDASASYEAAMDQLDLVMKGMSVDQVLNVVKDYLEVGDLEMVIRKMPTAEAEEIFDTLRKMSK